MRFALVLASLVASAFAQSIDIVAPGTIAPGSNVSITLERSGGASANITEVAVTLSIVQCAGSDGTHCPDPSEQLGTTLYEGPYTPHTIINVIGPAHPFGQVFQVTVPEDLRSGTQAQIGAVHLSLVGDGPKPFYEIKSVVVDVE